MELLSKYTQRAIQSYHGTSFSPERRGERIVKEYSEQLAEDIKELESQGIEKDIIAGYKSKYENLFSNWIGAKSRCLSTMIAGPSNFPVRRAEKANRSEERHYELWQVWREKAKKSIVRKSQPEKTFLSEIDRYKAELEGMKKNHELMKQGNVMIKKARKDGKDITQELKELLNLNDFNAKWAMQYGFGLQNNNANIKRVEQRIKELEVKENMLEKQPLTKYSFEGGEFHINYEVDRVQIFFTEKPTHEELRQWKEKGLSSYNWSPSAMAWQRKITSNAMYSLKRMFDKITKL